MPFPPITPTATTPRPARRAPAPAAPASSVTPAETTPAPTGTAVVMDGEVKVVGENAAPTKAKSARARRTVRVPVKLPLAVVDALLRVPSVVAEIEMHRRLTIIQVMGEIVPCLLSSNLFAKAVGLPASTLSRWVQAYSAGGTKALRPKSWAGGLHPKKGSRSEHLAFLEFETAPDTDAAS